MNQPQPEAVPPAGEQAEAKSVPPQTGTPKRSVSPAFLIGLFVVLIALAAFGYVAVQRQTVRQEGPTEQIATSPVPSPTPDADALPTLSQSDDVQGIESDLNSTVVNEDDSGYTEVNTNLNSL